MHCEGDAHKHHHGHAQEHHHVHDSKGSTKNTTPWILFTIFIFGPCEPLIPILMYPAAKGSMSSVVMVVSVFGTVTIITMLAMVLLFSYGVSKIAFNRFERYSHALAGLIIFFCGGAIKFLGL